MLKVDPTTGSSGNRINIIDTTPTLLSANDLLDQILSQPKETQHSSVFIQNLDVVRSKLEKLIENGPSAFEVVTDFDRTLSKYSHNGKLIPTCHGIFEMDPELTEDTKSMLTELRNKYYPIEIDLHMTEQEKIPKMLEWWELSHQTIIDCGIHRAALEKTVRECNLILRERVRDFLRLLANYQIPVLVFSAGLGDVIDLFLRYSKVYYDNMRVVSNFMRFDHRDQLVGFTTPIIHSFNKTAASITNSNLPKRPGVLLVGDSTGDVHMADGATINDPYGRHGIVLRVGFLNELIDEKMEKYQSMYDIVLVNDDTFNVPLKIVSHILQHRE